MTPFKMLLLPPYANKQAPERYVDERWPDMIRAVVPGATVEIYENHDDVGDAIVDADAVYGAVPPDMFARARKLRWLAAPGAGLGPDWYHPALVESDVVVTNIRGIYNEHLSAHIMAMLLYFARRFDHYGALQRRGEWKQDRNMVELVGAVALILGVGGSGAETAKLCAALGMHVIGVDPRVQDAPEGMAEILTPDHLDARLADADFVIVTAPETPATRGMFNADLFARMKRGAYFINVGRGGIVVTDDLVAALESGQVGGAGLDVIIPEPLPADHPLWSMGNVLLTPHVAVFGAPNQQRREEILIENCRRFGAGEPLLNLVDKRNWF